MRFPLIVFWRGYRETYRGIKNRKNRVVTVRYIVVSKIEKVTVHDNRDNRVVTVRFCTLSCKVVTGDFLVWRRARGAEAVREVRSGTTTDGFIWRKYGQKEINGCKHPRLYYRCAFRGQGCLATRRVQQSQSQDDPAAAFVIAYYGEHTCGGDAAAAAACRDGELMPPAVINSGASSFAAAWNMASREPASSLAVERRSCDGDAPSETSQGWSPSFSSEVELDVVGFDLAGADSSASPVWEFLNGSFDWEFVINSL